MHPYRQGFRGLLSHQPILTDPVDPWLQELQYFLGILMLLVFRWCQGFQVLLLLLLTQ